MFFANGRFSGDSVRFEGRFRLAAMGAESPFAPIRMSGRLTAERLVDGRLHATEPVELRVRRARASASAGREIPAARRGWPRLSGSGR